LHFPVAIFAYNRKKHLSNTIQALLNCDLAGQSDVFIFIDGPKKNASIEEINAIKEVSSFVHSIEGFKSIQIIEQSTNLGLTNSVAKGISLVLSKAKAVIVLEDDIVVGKDFLNFMNNALVKYENEPQIAGISGYSFPINEHKAYLTRTGSCWGWATYKRVWDDFIKKREQLNLDLIETNEHDLFNVYDNLYGDMFLQTKQGIIQSWAVEFYLYYFSKKQFFLMPGVNLIANEGFDGSGAHHKKGNFLTDNNPIGSFSQIDFPAQIKEEKPIRMKIEALYQKGHAKPSMINSFVSKIKSVLLGNENNHH
jgi:glycosyltransferase involved in cell wall biosynthesis